MLTDEQIKNLKHGDPIVINGTVNKIDEDGHILATCGGSAVWLDNPDKLSLPGETVEQPKPKHDPTRPYKKGDIVQPRSGKTVMASEYGFVTFHELAGQYEVNEDEARGTVTLIVNGHACFVSVFALELITPVEEMESFGVRYSTDRDCAEVYHRRYKNTVAAFYCKYGITREQAEEHAEAEAARLNAEWRKEQNNE